MNNHIRVLPVGSLAVMDHDSTDTWEDTCLATVKKSKTYLFGLSGLGYINEKIRENVKRGRLLWLKMFLKSFF